MTSGLPKQRSTAAILICLLFLQTGILPVHAEEKIPLFKSQTVYVPVYSHIYVGNREISFNLSANLSVRNTDPHHAITVHRIDYYDSDGKLVKHYLEKSQRIAPMASHYCYVKSSDKTGGWGANFIVEWKSDKPVNEPLVECVMSGMKGSHSISFVRKGQEIRKNAGE